MPRLPNELVDMIIEALSVSVSEEWSNVFHHSPAYLGKTGKGIMDYWHLQV